MLRVKLLRDLWRGRAQVLAVVAVIGLGTALFCASYLAYEDLQGSYRDTQLRTHLADTTLDVAAVSSAQARQVAALPGVAAAEAQTVVDLPITLPDARAAAGQPGTTRLVGRLIGVPLGAQPPLDQVVLLAGRYPTQPDEALVERHLAKYYDLQPGATVRVDGPNGPLALRVAGVAVSAEYLWVARSRQDPMPTPADFGVLFVPQPAMAALGQAAAAAPTAIGADQAGGAQTALRLAAAGEGNRLLYSLRPGADAAATLRAVEGVLGPGAVLAATPRADLVGVQLLQLDVDGLQELALAFPILFLTVGGFIVAALLHRRVDGERPLIGTLLALGTRPGAVLRHYLAYALAIGLLGALPGAVAGVLLAGLLTRSYAQELAIPFVTTRLDPLVIGIAVVIGVAAPALAAIVPARRAARLAPATAMRAYLPTGAATTRLARLPVGGLPLWLRLPVRDLARHPWRAATTAAGVGAALILLVTTGGMLDATQRGLDLTFNQSQRYDLRADFLAPQPAPALQRAVAALPGVRGEELILSLPVRVETLAGDRAYETVLQGLPQPSPLLAAADASGAPLPLHPGGAVLSRTVAQRLRIKSGDRIRVRALPTGPAVVVTVDALSESLMGNAVTLPLDAAASAFHLPGTATAALLSVDPAQRAAVRGELERLPGAAQVTDLAAMRTQLDQLLGLAVVFLGVMLLCGVVLAAAILYNTATLGILERQRELATMRALGEHMHGIARLVTVEHGLIAIAGLLVGFPVAVGCLHLFLRLSSSDLFSFPFWLSPRTIVATILGVALTLLIAQQPALRTLGRLNLAEAAKLRE